MPHVQSPRHKRRAPLKLTLLLALLGLALLFVSGAPAQTVHAHKTSCPLSSKSRHHASKASGGCSAKHASHKHKHAAKKPAHKKGTSKAATLVPASCEDGTVPTHAADGSFSCQDGSEPGCEDGSTPVRSSSGGALLCHVAKGSEESEEEAGACEQESEGECPATGSWSCEEGEEACQASPAEEAEAS